MLKWISTLVLFSYSASVATAADFRILDGRQSGERTQAEYYNANKDRRLENRINFISGVQVPGIYHFPDNTNLVEAISLAGGAEKDADLSKVYVKRYTKDGYTTFKYDLSDMVSKNNVQFPTLSDRDTVLLEVPHSSQNTLFGLTIVATILGIATSTFLLIQYSKKN